jgi:hypothetical protein
VVLVLLDKDMLVAQELLLVLLAVAVEEVLVLLASMVLPHQAVVAEQV